MKKESTCFNLWDNDFDLGNDWWDTESKQLDNGADAAVKDDAAIVDNIVIIYTLIEYIWISN